MRRATPKPPNHKRLEEIMGEKLSSMSWASVRLGAGTLRSQVPDRMERSTP